ncbi:MAG TPA: hypothetical protein VE441_12830 [Mycobacterium sp.]|nr:hypothetical protein [Mycobacterium sp.]
MSRRTQRRAMAAWAAHIRETSRYAARELALTIVDGRSPGMQAYDLGIVLNDGETAWQQVPADYWYRSERSWIVQHNSYRGYRSIINEVHQPCLIPVGMLDWLITNHRLAARKPDGQVMSICWSDIEAITVDLVREIVVFDGADGGDGYHGELAGPAVAPIAVAAIATCHGPQVLLDHPALEQLRVPPPNAPGYGMAIEREIVERQSEAHMRF